MKSKILQVTLTLKGNNSSGTQSKLIRDGTQNQYKEAYESLQNILRRKGA